MKVLEFGFTAEDIIAEGHVTREEITQLQSWLSDENLPRLTDEQVVVFLISYCKDVEQVKNKIRGCYYLCKIAPNIANNRNLDREDLQQQLNVWPIFVIPEKTDDGSVIIFSKLVDTNYKNIEVVPSLTLTTMAMNAAFYDYPPKALIYVCDLKGLSIMHLTKIKFRLAKLFFDFLQQGMPIKLVEIHMLNTSHFADKALMILKPFISSKFLDMVHFHPQDMDMDVFSEKWLPKRCLPKEYGGDLPHSSILHAKHVKKLRQMQMYFEAEEQQRQFLYL